MAASNPSLGAAPLISDWLDLDTPGVVRARTGKSELGQGIRTALVQIVADALGVDCEMVQLAAPDTDGPDETFTAGSLSVQHSGSALHAAATQARLMFLAAARDRLGVEPVQMYGAFAAGDRRLTYSDLAGSVDLHVVIDPSVEAAEAGSLVGTDLPRTDLADKILGRPRYLQDMRLPGMLFGRMVRPPARGARLHHVDRQAVLDLPGVVDVVRDGSVLAVIADDEIAALEAVARLRDSATWETDPSDLTDDGMTALLTSVATEDTSVADGPALEDPTLTARYTRPFIAHASIGPACAIAHEDAGTLQVWSHTQGVFPLRRDMARALGRSEDSIRITHVEGAGCYGHNPADDVAYDAALLAVHLPGRPIQVTWSREDELGWSPFGPAMVVDIAASTDDTGQITAWSWDGYGNGHSSRPSTLATPSLLAFELQADGQRMPPSGDPPVPAGAGTARNAVPGYEVGPVRAVSHRALAMPIRASALRSLGAHLNVVAIESHLDDLARMHGEDPVEYRLRHLTDTRGRAVLESVARASEWGGALPDGHGRGVGYGRYKGSGAWCAAVVEVEAETSVQVTRVWLAADCGRVVSPDGARNQLEGGALQSLSWTLMERVRFSEGRVTSDTWEEYPILTFSQAPLVHVELADRARDPWLGAGEASMGPTAAAVANAVVDALGVRVRDLPITAEAIIAAMED